MIIKNSPLDGILFSGQDPLTSGGASSSTTNSPKSDTAADRPPAITALSQPISSEISLETLGQILTNKRQPNLFDSNTGYCLALADAYAQLGLTGKASRILQSTQISATLPTIEIQARTPELKNLAHTSLAMLIANHNLKKETMLGSVKILATIIEDQDRDWLTEQLLKHDLSTVHVFDLAETLSIVGGSKAISKLEELFAEQTDPIFKVAVAVALKKLTDLRPEQEMEIAQILQDIPERDLDTKIKIAMTLTNRDEAFSRIESIMKSIINPESGDLATCVKALGELPGERSIGILRDVLKDESNISAVKLAAAESLLKIDSESKESGDLIRQTLASILSSLQERYIHDNAFKLAARIGDKSTIESLKPFLEKDDINYALPAINAMAQILRREQAI